MLSQKGTECHESEKYFQSYLYLEAKRAYSYLKGDKILMRKSLRKISWRKYLCF